MAEPANNAPAARVAGARRLITIRAFKPQYPTPPF
jgi:hypothetical protein